MKWFIRIPRAIIIGLALAAAANFAIAKAQAVEPVLSACDTGSWYDPSHNGEGLSLEVFGPQFAGYLYTYEYRDGAPAQTWLVFLGDTATGDGKIYDVLAGYVDGEVNATIHEVGAIQVERLSGGLAVEWSLSLDFNRTDGGIPWCLSNCQTARSMRQLTRPITCT